jgi:hypothetical protein
MLIITSTAISHTICSHFYIDYYCLLKLFINDVGSEDAVPHLNSGGKLHACVLFCEAAVLTGVDLESLYTQPASLENEHNFQ